MKKWHKRGIFIVTGLVLLGGAAYFVSNALNSSIAFYITPTEVAAGKTPSNKPFRVGGMVKSGSISRKDLEVNFIITDFAHDVQAKYTGSLPDLFKENSGAVAQGKMVDGVFVASEVLAKHDENYTPPPAQHALDKAAENKKNNAYINATTNIQGAN